MRKALLVMSGGQDSSTLLFWCKREFSEVEAIIFDYGQRHQKEIQCAVSICEENQVKYSVLKLPFLNEITENALTRNNVVIETIEGNLPNTFVDGRNHLFLSIAAVIAKGKRISDVVTGVCQTDFSGYPDCRDIFVKSLNVTLNLAMEYPFQIHTPLMWMTKEQVWSLADELGELEYIRKSTLTCYNGIVGDGCGDCPSCKLRENGLQKYLDRGVK